MKSPEENDINVTNCEDFGVGLGVDDGLTVDGATIVSNCNDNGVKVEE